MGEITKTIRFEIETAILSLKKYDTWIFLSGIFALILLLYKEVLWAILMLIMILVLDAARSHSTGQVTDYFRKKYKQQIDKKEVK